MPMMPLLISLAIATISSAYILQDHQQEVSKANHEAALEGFKSSVKALSPQFSSTECEQLNDKFANDLPTGTIWTVTLHQPRCDWAELQLTLPTGINPRATFPTVRNDHISGQTIALPLNLVNTLSPYTPYQQKLKAAQRNATRTCTVYNCGGNSTGVDITAPVANFTVANDNVEGITGNLMAKGIGITNDPLLDLGGTCEKDSTITIYHKISSLGDVRCKCSDAETETSTDIPCKWDYEATIIHGKTHQFKVTATDWINNTSKATKSFDVIGDMVKPQQPKIALNNDTGSNPNDGITSNGAYSITNPEPDATLEYSTDGTNWSATAPTAMEGKNSIQARQTDVAGNMSNAAALGFTLDNTRPSAPTITLNNDTGSNTSDGITSNGAYSITNPEPDATLEYSTDGTNWSVTAPTAMEGKNSIQARQIDVAGNRSSKATLNYRLDTTEPVFTSGNTASIDENKGASTVIYQAIATNYDDTRITYSLAGTDASSLNIDTTSGKTKLNESADYETKSSYNIKVIATDIAGNTAIQSVQVKVNDINTIVNGKSAAQCINAGGSLHNLNGGDNSICRFAGSSCPTGWRQYGNWSTSISKQCGEKDSYWCGGGSYKQCTTGAHSFSNTPLEQCNYQHRYSYGKWYSKKCGRYNVGCTATITEVGCY